MKSASKHTQLLKIVVLGYIVRGPLGGLTWHHLQYFLGLHNMGHDVYYIEDSGNSEYCCYNPRQLKSGTDASFGLQYASDTFTAFGLNERWAYYNEHLKKWQGPIASKIVEKIADADLLINLSNVNPIRPWLQSIPAKALIDTDPVFTQIDHINNETKKQLSSLHTAYFTFGENIGKKECGIPNDGFPWKATRQPIVMDQWPLCAANKNSRFTTMMKWESYPGLYYKGSYFGMKAESFLDYFDLPSRSNQQLEIAVSDSATPRQQLMDNGWQLCDPLQVAATPFDYRQYIQTSKGEFSVAKSGYVKTTSGWFSERSACYLASGRPVVVQDTGFTQWMKKSDGLLSFSNPDEAVNALYEADRNYNKHCLAARELAIYYFDASKVLSRLIDQIFSSANKIFSNISEENEDISL